MTPADEVARIRVLQEQLEAALKDRVALAVANELLCGQVRALNDKLLMMQRMANLPYRARMQ